MALDGIRAKEEPVDAILAPAIPDQTGERDSDDPRLASLPDLLVTKAKQTDAGISFIEDERVLESVGGVGPLTMAHVSLARDVFRARPSSPIRRRLLVRRKTLSSCHQDAPSAR